MIRPVVVVAGERRYGLAEVEVPLALDALLPGALAAGAWEVELGFGKGRYLLRRALAEPAGRFLGVEAAREYFELAARRAARQHLRNLILLAGEASYLLAAVLPRGFAETLHVYFPDPWPKSRHLRRRLFAPSSLDLVLGLLAPGGRLCLATDFLNYGEEIEALLRNAPGVEARRLAAGWPDGPRTNYEAKYIAEGRPILRLEARVVAAPAAALDPRGRRDVLVAYAPPRSAEVEE